MGARTGGNAKTVTVTRASLEVLGLAHRLNSETRSRLNAALIKARWLNAWGVFPSCSPLREISSENMSRWFEKPSMFSKRLTALTRYLGSYMLARVMASTSQKVHIEKAPSRPPTPVFFDNLIQSSHR